MSKIRLGIIGNSHIVAYRRGWDEAREITQGFKPTFLAAGAARLAFRIEGTRLVAVNEVQAEVARISGGMAAADMADHDAFIIVGLTLRLRSVVEIYKSHRLPEHAKSGHQVLSHQALERAAYGLLINSTACQVLKQLRQIGNRPCLLVEEPLPSTKILTTPETSELWDADFVLYLYQLYRECLRRISEEERVEIIRQPDDLIVPPCFTADAYSAGAVSLRDALHEPSECFHMNTAFGRRMLPVVLSRVAAAVG